jgi:dihydroorotase
MKLCIKNGLIINPKTHLIAVGNLWIQNDKICCIEMDKECIGMIPPKLDKETKIIDATGKLVIPGLIDLHVHLREPGAEYKEDIESGCNAAARGGFTTICCMPNTNPVIDCKEIVEFIDRKTRIGNGVKVLSIGAMSKGQEGKEISDIDGMVNANTILQRLIGRGICGISEDGKSLADVTIMLQAMKMAKKLNMPVLSHAEDLTMPGSAMGEALITARDIMLSKETGCHVHFCHVSVKKAVDLIRDAKKEGLAVTAETAPHYFALNKEMIKGDTNKKMNPPLRNKEDVLAIIKGLTDGTIDIIATDHAPHSKKEKDCDFEKAANGVIGLETSFAVGYTNLVETGTMSLMKLVETMSCRPAEIIGLDSGDISPGKSADVSVIDVEKSYTVKSQDFMSKAENSPFIGAKLFGKVLYTIADGKIIWESKTGGYEDD